MRLARGSLLIALALLAGCSTPPATLELLAVARAGLADALEAQRVQHADTLGRLDAQSAALDAAFDADVRLVAAGGVQDADGNPVALTPEWVISTRQGYAAAVGALAEQRRLAEREHAIRADNLAAADEALEMAAELISRQSNMNEDLRQYLLALQRRWIDER